MERNPDASKGGCFTDTEQHHNNDNNNNNNNHHHHHHHHHHRQQQRQQRQQQRQQQRVHISSLASSILCVETFASSIFPKKNFKLAIELHFVFCPVLTGAMFGNVLHRRWPWTIGSVGIQWTFRSW